MKYVILSSTQREYSVLFPDILVHQSVADGVRSRLRKQNIWSEVVAGGFLSVNDNGVIVGVYGESETLKIGNRGKDDLFVIYADLGLLGVSNPVGRDRENWLNAIRKSGISASVIDNLKTNKEQVKINLRM